ncbi:MAG: putative membrane protein YphA (DoxX/SURF4 family) [Flavobacteriaceae bacterium]|jgi:uncharacterized membrane protein YphA (DoxX/SURF4 family)
METIKNRAVGVLIIRLILGLIFLMQGFGKVFTIGVENVYNGFFKVTFHGYLPEAITYATAYYTSYIELLGGLLLIIGLKRDLSLYFLGSVLIIVSFGHGLVEPIWELDHVMYRLILLSALLLLPKTWDIYSLDNLRSKGKKN